MALSLPIPVEDFWDAIPLQQGGEFEPDEALNANRTAGGTIVMSSSGDRLWGGAATFGLAPREEYRPAAAVLNAVRQAGVPFLCYDRTRPFPASDPLGAVAARTITVAATSTTRFDRISLGGFLSGYVLTAGDLIGFTDANEAGRYHLHELAEGKVVGGDGTTGWLRVTPFLKVNPVVGTQVSLIRPLMTAVYNPGSFSAGRGMSGGIETGRTFRFIQTMEY